MDTPHRWGDQAAVVLPDLRPGLALTLDRPQSPPARVFLERPAVDCRARRWRRPGRHAWDMVLARSL